MTLKKTSLWILAAVAIICTPEAGAKVVENPAIEAATTAGMLDIRKVETGKEGTRLLMHATYRPKYWIQIAQDAVLSADGKDYKMIGGEGIEPGKHFWMPESGEADFTLIFEPLPKTTKQVDFKEPGEDGWKIWGIDLTGKADYTSPHPDIPKKLVENKAPFYFEPSFESGETTVTVHLLGYRPEMGDNLSYTVSSYADSSSENPAIKIGDDGVSEPVRFRQDGSAIFSVFGVGGLNIGTRSWIAPGDSLDLYIDCRISGNQTMDRRANHDKQLTLPFADNGKYSAVNNLMFSLSDPDLIMIVNNKDVLDKDMSGDEYTDYFIGEYNRVLDNIQKKKLTEGAAEICRLNAQGTLLYAIANSQLILLNNHMRTHPDADYKEVYTLIKPILEDRHYAKAAEIASLDNPQLYLAGGQGSMGRIARQCWQQAGIDSKQIQEYMLYSDMLEKAKEGKLTGEDSKKLNAECTHAMFAQHVDRVNKEQLDKLSKLDASLITPTPEVAPDKVFDEIIAQYKGKVVLVDLWNTWCGPCRNAIKLTEPEKSGELADDNIVWIYIANETSPMTKYLELIPGIKGTHYRVGSDVWESICDRFKVDGIPFYILVDHEGNATGRPDLRDHSKFKKTLLEEAAKCM